MFLLIGNNNNHIFEHHLLRYEIFLGNSAYVNLLHILIKSFSKLTKEDREIVQTTKYDSRKLKNN